MHLPRTQSSLLHTLLCLARADVPATARRLAAELGLPPAEVERDLALLARRGLVDADRVRLTFVGLMHAAGGASIAAPMERRQAA
jgi:DNA-binding IclR family transcriptional regulator